MISYSFENGLNIHEITALYSKQEMALYHGDMAELAAGLANSTMMTARDEGRLVGMIRGVSDMHTVLFIDELIVLPEYSEDNVDQELLGQFLDYFKQIDRVVAVSEDGHLRKLLEKEGFKDSDNHGARCMIRPRKLLEIRY
jgi:ribosomal protein S18 acetylase RimI-like enzyme